LYFGHQPAVKTSLTALENLAWFFGLNGNKRIDGVPCHYSRPDLIQALASVGMHGYEDVPCHQMSAGQQRRVALARLYLSEAPLWILDEPFTAIDKKGVTALEKRIVDHAEKGGLVLLTTHQALSIDNLKVLDIADFKPVRSEVFRD